MNNPWEKIETPSHDLLYRLIDESHPLRLLRAKDIYGRFLFIYEFPPSDHIADKFPDLNGIDLHLQEPHRGQTGNCMLLLILKEKKDWQIFLSLCNDLTDSTRGLEQGIQATQIILRRLKRWQIFLQKTRSGLLSEREIKGLIGELFFIKNHLAPAFGAGPAVQFWQGPEDSPQDFNVHDCAIEVKCQLGTTTPQVRISSADQLCSQLPEMFLYVVTLGKAERGMQGGINLPGIIKIIRQQIESDSPADFEHFNNLLYQTGYLDLEEYEQFNYLVASEKVFSVTENFPRICTEDLLPGVERVAYNIKLKECLPFAASPDWMELI